MKPARARNPKKYRYASTIKGSDIHGKHLNIRDLPHVDLIICGSVAVTKTGARVGKGGGYSELEYGILRELNLVDKNLPILTSVHELQIVDSAPIDEHDFTVDIISTPTGIHETNGANKRPTGIIWDKIDAKRIKEMPILEQLRKELGVSPDK